jgi:hypothetical protein
MSESSGGRALKETSVSANQIEVRLLFESRDYTLPQLTDRLQDVDALMNLLLQSKAVLNPRRPVSKKRQSQMSRLVAKRTTSARKIARAFPDAFKGFKVTRHIRGFGPRSFRYVMPPSTQVRVETVSLSSPLEIVLLITGPVAVLTAVAKLLPKVIKIKNDWNESRVVRAESNLKIERLKLEQEVVKLVAAEVEKVDMDTYFALPENHPSKKVVKRSTQALSALDKADVRK